MKYAQTGTKEFRDDDGDLLVLKEEPTGSQYDERMGLLGTMRIPGKMIDENKDMESLFANGEMVELNTDKKALAEFQFKALFVSMTLAGRTITSVSEAVGIYRKIDKSSKDWIDEQVDGVWKQHEDSVSDVVAKEGESVASSAPSSVEIP